MTNFIATSGNDTFTAATSADTLTISNTNQVGGAGVTDSFVGAGGSVILSGTTGGVTADFTQAGVTFLGWGGFTFQNNSGTDSVVVSSTEISGAQALKGALGIDLVTVNMASTGTFDASAWTLTTWGSNDHVIINGTSGADTIKGTNATGAGDSLVGGGGNDTYYVNYSGDTVVGGAGTDTVHTTASSWSAATNGANVDTIILDGTANISATGNTLANTITGNSGINTLNDGGVGGADTMTGGAGNDIYVVNNAGDQIVELAGGGTDTVQSSISWSIATLANVENVTLTGSNSINATGNAGANVLTGNSSANTLNGAGGNDTLNGGQGADVMIGGGGSDTYIVDNASDTCVEALNAGKDTVQASVTYSLGANIENLVLSGTAAINGTGNELNNLITGNSAANLMTGNAGNDILNGGHNSGAFLNIGDTMDGGAGNDTYYVNNLNDTIINEAAGSGVGFVDTAIVSVNNYQFAAANVEKITLSGSALNLTVTSAVTNGVNVIGTTGNNTITTSSGNDTINGGFGADTMNGGLGNDTYYVDNSGDVVNDTGGTDTVNSTITFSLLTNATGIENLILGGSSAINGTGDNNANTLTGNTGNNILTGNGGNDIIDGKQGADTMIGGAGNDTYYVDSVKDVVDESTGGGTGTDTVNSSVTFSLSDGVHALGTIENLTLTGTANINATGNAVANILIGNSGSNNINDGGVGGAGDTMQGGAGDDTYVVNNATDIVDESANGGAGTDTIVTSVSFSLADAVHVLGNVENISAATGSANISLTGNGLDNVIVGNDGANTIIAGAGNDIINGGQGNDTITGGAGIDQLAGGAGSDTFVFTGSGSTWDSGTTLATADIIQDFAQTGSTNPDKIDLSAIDANTTVAGDQAFTLASSGTAIGTAVLSNDGAGGTLISIFVDSSGVSKMVIDVQGVTGLVASDFIL